MNKPFGYWNKDRCIEESYKFSSRIDWIKKSPSSYSAARRNNWLAMCYKNPIIGSREKRLIYAFEFPDKSVYVGLTFDPNQRKNDHLNSRKNKKSSVFKYIEKTGLKPDFKLLTEFLDVVSAKYYEEKFLEKYKNNGWSILNRIKTGGLGGSTIKWTKEKCINEAKKFTNLKDWRNLSSSSYVTAKSNRWLNEASVHMKRFIKNWSKEECIIEAANYKSRVEWKNNSINSYYSAIRHGWSDICTSHMKVLWAKKWNLENCMIDALKYKKRSFWSKYSNGAYEAARKNKWLELCCKHMK
jgi:hypothetical protein